MRLSDATSVIILLGFGLLTSSRLALANGSVGCLFTKSLCEPKLEWCFDGEYVFNSAFIATSQTQKTFSKTCTWDEKRVHVGGFIATGFSPIMYLCLYVRGCNTANVEHSWVVDYAFGRCLSHYENDEELDFYQYDLKGSSLQLLRRELERLMGLGYRWSHFYTQCVLKALLFALRYQNEYNEDSCRVFSEEDEKPGLTFFDESLEKMDPKNVGQVQFTPSVVNPHAEYADEIYIPVLGKNTFMNEANTPGEDAAVQGDENYINDLRRVFLLSQINKNKRSKNKNPFQVAEIEELEDDEISPKYHTYLKEMANEGPSDVLPNDYITPFRTNYQFVERYNPDLNWSGLESRDLDLSVVENIIAKDKDILKSFSRNYNTPGNFRKGQETRDEVVYPRVYEMGYFNQPNDYFFPEERQFTYDAYNSREAEDLGKNNDGVYTEGGVVYLRGGRKGDLNDPDSLEDLMDRYNNWGFKRPERLDVKKPGPSFSTNNYAFQKGKEKDGRAPKDIVKAVEKSKSKPETQKSVTKIQPEKKKVGSPMESPSLRRHTTTMVPLKEKIVMGKSEGGDAYIELKNRVNTWQEGARIVRMLEELLRLSPNTFSNVKVEQNEVRFRVGPNRMNLNASEVVGRIENYKDLIQRTIGVEVVSAGVGEQSKLPTSKSLLGGDERQLWILSFLLCGVIAAVAIVGAALFVIKRHSLTREKLQNLSHLDTEASKDYQDLCRARMATKTAQEKPDGSTSAGHRVSNLARESEGSNHSPSSRSSTSSWSEEPALTNMDISTGHMVLSYMEDHLQNKDRLEQEWIALCAYEAEPCSATIAVKGENNKKNRYGDVLPYDHARVILNELTNISGSDYINASTITDHDPRNPAYIATQGPLSHTAADFWQMVWEQGSVVMVMLTRLTENGTAMCHRYWPEEGSQLYHIYEVHLVSEHIWCDDYLVRSFYLKNLKTGETRTVTQFHFLSWPENGIPLSTKALLEFRRKVNKSYRGRSCPIVVHCSDGVGRTGTYCLIDMVLNRMGKGAKEIDIAATLEHIRDQRPLMVRTKQQFEFVLMAVAEEVHAILKALPTNPNHSPPPIVKEKE